MDRSTLTSSELDYELPASSIAQHAVEPRDASRLLVVSGLKDRRFTDLPELVSPGDLLVVNRTRVRPSRLHGAKTQSGGAVELLLLRPVDPQQNSTRWEALIRPVRRIRPGAVLDFEDLTAVVVSVGDAGVVVVDLATEERDIETALQRVGEVPLPPYFTGELADPERYQTVFAERVGSAAAPTAALHFTHGLIATLERRGAKFASVELEVGLDTFRPIAVDDLADHVMHTERYVVPPAAAEAIAATKRQRGKIVAVGTTVVRTLESATTDGQVVAQTGVSSLFIQPGYRFRTVDALITNFHAPRTTLIALVAAAIGPSWRSVYRHAIESEYRFLSFGDSMFIDDVNAAAGGS